MELFAARHLALGLMRQHGLGRWKLTFDRAKVRAGQCRFDRHEISLSRPLTLLHDEAEVTETVLHEIAHALVGPSHHHDDVWKAKARALGARGETTLRTDKRPPAAWVGTCPAGHEVHRHQRPSRPRSCARCSRTFDLDALVTWRWNGQVVPMTSAYQAELAEVRQLYGVARGA
ncbi:protein of unknown function SprT [Beutenbergia cavernae DSM 12333]|uniref:SprT-like domain-containing protein n=1 Tax=Beutenbergia cavernae (strain ATCC BAA-8 / DSM 12333 / CCUG 43141 / JCM 11478 / NBRC 16432 / NCIMB 13614 / HKI 0122) TaxID=471853 RepID=C5BVN7_BEUC1|nr:SprT-like domain-containing protein [Beutenbergia cavernae]ACQ78477.1 protein of unknown function SprT [Beutenbergia cavernae DSM 12333]